QAQGRVEHLVARLEGGVRDDRIDLALARAEDAKKGHSDGGAIDAAALIEVRPARAEDEHGGPSGGLEELLERPVPARLRAEPEPTGKLPRFGRIAARGGGHDGAGLDCPLATRQA